LSTNDLDINHLGTSSSLFQNISASMNIENQMDLR